MYTWRFIVLVLTVARSAIQTYKRTLLLLIVPFPYLRMMLPSLSLGNNKR